MPTILCNFQCVDWQSTVLHPAFSSKQMHRTWCSKRRVQLGALPAQETSSGYRLAELLTGKPLCYVVGAVP